MNHRWIVRSRHVTSEGLVVYESCSCGSWRISPGVVSPEDASLVGLHGADVGSRRETRPATRPVV